MPRKVITVDEFRQRFEEIKAMGYVKSTRRGPTGVGHTLENLMGLEEDNIPMPDFGEVELKGHRAGSDSLVTLFTYDRKCWKVKQLPAIRKYGTPDEKGNNAEGKSHWLLFHKGPPEKRNSPIVRKGWTINLNLPEGRDVALNLLDAQR